MTYDSFGFSSELSSRGILSTSFSRRFSIIEGRPKSSFSDRFIPTHLNKRRADNNICDDRAHKTYTRCHVRNRLGRILHLRDARLHYRGRSLNEVGQITRFSSDVFIIKLACHKTKRTQMNLNMAWTTVNSAFSVPLFITCHNIVAAHHPSVPTQEDWNFIFRDVHYVMQPKCSNEASSFQQSYVIRYEKRNSKSTFYCTAKPASSDRRSEECQVFSFNVWAWGSLPI